MFQKSLAKLAMSVDAQYASVRGPLEKTTSTTHAQNELYVRELTQSPIEDRALIRISRAQVFTLSITSRRKGTVELVFFDRFSIFAK